MAGEPECVPGAVPRRWAGHGPDGVIWPSACTRYQPGHTPHFIQANRSAEARLYKGRLVEVDGTLITLRFADRDKHYRNHDPERLLQIAPLGSMVRISEEWSLGRGRHGHCFSIAPPNQAWLECDFRSSSSASLEALLERIESHGGFLVPTGGLEGWSG